MGPHVDRAAAQEPQGAPRRLDRPERLAQAKALGANELVNASDGDPVEQVLDLTAGRGAAGLRGLLGPGKADDDGDRD